MPNIVAYSAVNTTLAVIDTVPKTALNRTTRIHRPRGGGGGCRQVAVS